MGAVANLETSELQVAPGQTVATKLSLVNTGTIVEQFTVLLLGEVAGWASVEPPVVSLFPQGQQTVTIRFAPPRHHLTPSGPIDFAAKVIPANEPEESVVEEGVITVGSFNDIGAELVPRTATGRLKGKQKLAVDSRGNVPVPVELSAFDAADAMKFHIRPSRVVASPGEARFTRVTVKPRQKFWKGSPQQKPYKVQIAPEGEKPLILDGSLTQKPVLPKWLLPLLGLLALLVLLWFLVLRPIVKSTAVTANAAALAAQAADNRRLSAQLAATQATVKALSGATPPTTAAAKPAAPGTPAATTTTTSTTVPGSTTTTSPTTTAGGTTATTQPPPVTGPNDGRIEVIDTPGQKSTNAFPALKTGQTLKITDLIVQNEGANTNLGSNLLIQRLTSGATKPELLLENSLSDLATQDEQYHFNTPMLFGPGMQLQIELDCNGGGGDTEAPPTGCDAAIYYIGSITTPADTPVATTIPNP